MYSLILLCFALVVTTGVFCEEVKPKVELGTVIGINLGTTYSCVGVFKNGRVEIIENDRGNRITPSYVAFTTKGERLIGDDAKNQVTRNPENTIFNVRRLLGRYWSDPTVQSDIKLFPFKVVEIYSKPHIEVETIYGPHNFTTEEISAMVLTKMKETAESYLGQQVTHAVMTVPSYFNDAQRQATKDAGAIAGLNVMRIINGPTAAAIAYGLNNQEGEKNVLVFDLGGGSCDVSLLTIDHGVFQVIATNGDNHLGGEDFDERIMDHFIKLYKKNKGKDIRKNNKAVQKLRREVERAKRTLSATLQTTLEIEYFFDGYDFSETLTRAKFEELNMDLFRSTLQLIQKVLEDADMKKEDVDEIVLVGGSTRIPKIQQLIKEYFNGKEPFRRINPEEAVAYGAAVQAGVLSGEKGTKNLVLLDVNPLTVGIKADDGEMDKLIPRNTVLPTRKSTTYTTTVDNQDTVTIAVYEGEKPMAEDNNFLGEFDLTGIRPAPSETTNIKVTFEIDVNGILQVSAKDGTGNKEKITINNRLTPDDIEGMVEFAKRFADEDKAIKEKVEARDDLERYVSSIKYQIGDLKILKVDETLTWLERNQDSDSIEYKKQKKDLEEIVNPIIAKLYQQEKAPLPTEAKDEL